MTDQLTKGVAEGLNDIQKKIEDTINKLEDRLKHAKTPEQWDNIKNRIERLQAGLKRSKQGVAEGVESLDYQGNCTEDDVVDDIFGDVNNFANMVEEYGDEFTRGDLVVKYDPKKDVHYFYYNNLTVDRGTLL